MMTIVMTVMGMMMISDHDDDGADGADDDDDDDKFVGKDTRASAGVTSKEQHGHHHREGNTPDLVV